MDIDEMVRRQRGYLNRVRSILGNSSEEEVMAVYREVNKDRRTEEIKARRERAKKEATREPATEKQRKYLKDLGVDQKGLTKAEASRIIKEKLREWKELR